MIIEGKKSPCRKTARKTNLPRRIASHWNIGERIAYFVNAHGRMPVTLRGTGAVFLKRKARPGMLRYARGGQSRELFGNQAPVVRQIRKLCHHQHYLPPSLSRFAPYRPVICVVHIVNCHYFGVKNRLAAKLVNGKKREREEKNSWHVEARRSCCMTVCDTHLILLQFFCRSSPLTANQSMNLPWNAKRLFGTKKSCQ